MRWVALILVSLATVVTSTPSSARAGNGLYAPFPEAARQHTARIFAARESLALTAREIVGGRFVAAGWSAPASATAGPALRAGEGVRVAPGVGWWAAGLLAAAALAATRVRRARRRRRPAG